MINDLHRVSGESSNIAVDSARSASAGIGIVNLNYIGLDNGAGAAELSSEDMDEEWKEFDRLVSFMSIDESEKRLRRLHAQDREEGVVADPHRQIISLIQTIGLL